MSLPAINSYSQIEIEEACRFSSALSAALTRINSNDSLVALRNRIWAEAALATFHNKSSAESICRIWSHTADQILEAAAQELNLPEGLALFAFGKLGSNELNLSSDVDIIYVSETESPEHLKFLRKFQQRLSEATAEGFLFRVDFDLRPGGKLGSMIPTVDQFIDFYGNYGETWERLAFVRLRAVFGSTKIISEINMFTKKFVFRKHLDFSLLEDLKALRTKVHEHYWKRSQNGNVDLKLGLGGIRDLELFTHALQVVHGGKDKRLHQSETAKALESFSLHKILPSTDVTFLKDFYWQLRTLENLVQCENDQQTHILKDDTFVPSNLAEFKAALIKNMARCDQIVSDLLGKITDQPQHIPQDLSMQLDWLRELGFSSEELTNIWPEIFQMPVLSRNKERDLEVRNRFLFQFLSLLSKQGPPSNGLALTKDFLIAVKAKTSFYSMLISNPTLMEMLVQLFSHSPYLAHMICSRPELIDSLVIRNIEEPSINNQSTDEFLEALAERRMLAEVVSGAEFLREESFEVIQKNLTATADSICLSLLECCAQEVGERPPHILALGKWGGQELGFGSDLDCIFVTEKSPTEKDHKIVRRFINRLTQTQRGGSLYAIDTRLKMTGAGGVLMTSHEDLITYLESKAEIWERQAYLRGRWLTSTRLPSVAHHCIKKQIRGEELSELEKIRISLLKNSRGPVDLKYSEGGLVDLEFTVQIAILKNQVDLKSHSTKSMIHALALASSDWQLHTEHLIRNYDLLRLAEQYQRLLSDEQSSSISTDQIYLHPIAKRLNIQADQLLPQLEHTFASQLAILKKLDPRRSQSY